MTGSKLGLKTAFDMAMNAQQEPAPAVAASLPLFPADQIASLPADPLDRADQINAPRGRGRPADSRNKSTLLMREVLLRQYRHPAFVLAETYSRPVQDLAAELGCTKAEAKKMQDDAASALLPYLMGKMGVVDSEGRELPMIAIIDPTALAQQAVGGGVVLPLAGLSPIEQNQGVIEGQAVEVQQRQSNSELESVDEQGLSEFGPLIRDQQA